MTKTTAAILFILAASLSLAQERPPIAIQSNTLYVGADGKFESAPDTALVQFNISAQEDTARAAYDRAARNAEQIRQTGGGVNDVGRLVALASHRHGSEIGGIGLDQDAIERHLRGHGAQILGAFVS